METTRLTRISLIAGHAAVALLALTGLHVALPSAPRPQWHVVGPTFSSVGQVPRRLPTSRRAERAVEA